MDDEHRAAFELLGIAVTSDREVVHRAFRRLARTVHPDVSADPEAAQRFTALAAAHQLASEPWDEQAHDSPTGDESSTSTRSPTRWQGPPIVAGPVRWTRHPVPSGARGASRRG